MNSQAKVQGNVQRGEKSNNITLKDFVFQYMVRSLLTVNVDQLERKHPSASRVKNIRMYS